MKKVFYTMSMAIAAVSMLASCGGEAEETSENSEETVEEVIPTFADECTGENDITFKVDNYGFQYDSTFAADIKFDVIRSTWDMKNDSTAELNLYNFEEGAADTTTNFNIKAKFRAYNGEVLGAGTYPYSPKETDNRAVSITINNSIGKVYFNWFAGMPDQGSIDLTFADADGACGSFALKVDEPDNTTYGHVELSGSFSTLK